MQTHRTIFSLVNCAKEKPFQSVQGRLGKKNLSLNSFFCFGVGGCCHQKKFTCVSNDMGDAKWRKHTHHTRPHHTHTTPQDPKREKRPACDKHRAATQISQKILMLPPNTVCGAAPQIRAFLILRNAAKTEPHLVWPGLKGLWTRTHHFVKIYCEKHAQLTEPRASRFFCFFCFFWFGSETYCLRPYLVWWHTICWWGGQMFFFFHQPMKWWTNGRVSRPELAMPEKLKKK